MGNCCCILRDKNKKKVPKGKKPLPNSQKQKQKLKQVKKLNKNYYKYGDDEYDNDDFDDEDETLDYDRQTTKSDLSSVKSGHNRSRNSLIDSKHKTNRSNRLLDKALLNQHQKQQQIHKFSNTNQQLASCSSSTILLLQQSHLLNQNNTSNTNTNTPTLNTNNIHLSYLAKNKIHLSPVAIQAKRISNIISEQENKIYSHNNSYKYALENNESEKIDYNYNSDKKRWSLVSNSKLVINELSFNENSNLLLLNNSDYMTDELNQFSSSSTNTASEISTSFVNSNLSNQNRSDDLSAEENNLRKDECNYNNNNNNNFIEINNVIVIVNQKEHKEQSNDRLISNSVTSATTKTTDITELKLNLETPKILNSKSSSTDDLTSTSNTDYLNDEITNSTNNPKRLAYRRRNSNLNQSLNETDLIINSSNKNKKNVNSKRKLKQRKIDLNENNEHDEYYHEEDDEEEYNSDDALNKINKNYLNYRSLQKSKRSIKSIELTIKNSRSIEKWLNDFDKIKELEQPAILESPQSTIKPDKIPNEEMYKTILSDLQFDDVSSKLLNNLQTKLVENIQSFLNLNSIDSTRSIETDMFNYVKKFVLPKSLANADDINYLKWFLNEKNFSLILQQPIIQNSNQAIFLLNCDNLNIKLESDESEIDESDQFYLVYSPIKQNLIINADKVKNILEKEKELVQATNLNNQGVLDSFREKYINTANFKGVQTLMSICKKNKKKLNLSANSASNTSATSSTSSTPVLNTSASNQQDSIFVNNSDLNDKLFLCFLSNFSCKLVENFLANHQEKSNLTFNNSAGFIRKHKVDKSFSYVNLINENEIKTFNFKLCLKLNKWPSGYDFSKRIKILKSSKILDYIEKQTCLITLSNLSNQSNDLEASFDEEEEDLKWVIDTRLAETIIFKSLPRSKLFLFYYFYLIINNLKTILENSFSGKSNEFKLENRVLFHHYLRFYDLNFKSVNESLSMLNSQEQLNKFYTNFSVYLRQNVISKYKTIYKPNYFNLDSVISHEGELDLRLDDFSNLLCRGETFFKNNKSSKSELNLNFKFMSPKQNNNRLFNEYLMDFFQILFEQFKSKRDHFKINEQVLIEIHEKVVKSNENLVKYMSSKEHDIDISAGLLSKFEMYAECVHKYLPQIRQHNQYLLFHYIWTMQVQYLAPFFNYICDIYKSYD